MECKNPVKTSADGIFKYEASFFRKELLYMLLVCTPLLLVLFDLKFVAQFLLYMPDPLMPASFNPTPHSTF